jgi:hypothetical protein
MRVGRARRRGGRRARALAGRLHRARHACAAVCAGARAAQGDKQEVRKARVCRALVDGGTWERNGGALATAGCVGTQDL